MVKKLWHGKFAALIYRHRVPLYYICYDSIEFSVLFVGPRPVNHNIYCKITDRVKTKLDEMELIGQINVNNYFMVLRILSNLLHVNCQRPGIINFSFVVHIKGPTCIAQYMLKILRTNTNNTNVYVHYIWRVISESLVI